MNNTKSTIILLFFLMTTLAVKAQTDCYPAYETEDYNILIDLKSMGYQIRAEDDAHRICDSLFYYQLHGMPPVDGPRWITNTGGSQNSSGVNTPPALLCELLKVYQGGTIEQLLNLYRSEDAATIYEILSVDSTFTQWQNITSQVNKFDVLMSLTQDDLTFMFVDAYYNNTVLFNTFYDFTFDEGTWHIAAASDSSAVMTNLYLTLNQFNPYSMLASDDLDGDGIPNLDDNCACTPNPVQLDSDGDGIGNVCDNCPYHHNPSQIDSDGDGVGDKCDNCAMIPNHDQSDRDNDGVGDVCDLCPDDFNPIQDYVFVNDTTIVGTDCNPDIDNDSIPNELDDDMDGDGWPNEMDNCPRKYNPNQADSDGDGIGDVCDNCQLNYNPNQEDDDLDGIGDVCDDDQDGDGIPDEYDNCPEIYNPYQEDEDCNGIGDFCQDLDNDGILDIFDNCPRVYNPDQLDSNHDGIGDACEDDN